MHMQYGSRTHRHTDSCWQLDKVEAVGRFPQVHICTTATGCCLKVLGSSWFRALIFARKYKLYEKWEETIKVPITKLSSSCSVLLSLLPYLISPFCLLSFHPSSFTSFSTFFLFLPLTWGSFQACGGCSLRRHSMHAVGGYDGACTIGRLIIAWAPALRTALLCLLRQHER